MPRRTPIPTPAALSRAGFFDRAARIVEHALGIAMRPNGANAAGNNRMGPYATDVHVGVVATEAELRVHLHSKNPARRRLLEAIHREVRAGTLAPPAGGLPLVVRENVNQTGIRYLEHAWPPQDLGPRDLAVVKVMAAWLKGVRARF